jgi:hypothetical protein
MRDLTKRGMTAVPPRLPKGLAFEIADLVRVRRWADCLWTIGRRSYNSVLRVNSLLTFHRVKVEVFYSGAGMPISEATSFVAIAGDPQVLPERRAPCSEQYLVIDRIRRVARTHSPSLLQTLQTVASVFGLAGMYLGSTTLHGSICYAVAIPCLITCVYARRLWGLLPLNLAQAVVIGINLARAL